MKQYLLFVLFFTLGVTVLCRAQQVHPDTVYVLFDTSSTETCTVDVEGTGYQEVAKFRKEAIENYIIFNICSEEFVFVKNRAPRDTFLSSEEVVDREFHDIDYLIEAFKESKPKKFKHNIFDDIYIVEKISNDKHIKYRVGWVDESIGWIE